MSSVGDLAGCDGRTIMPGMYTSIVGESRWKFPHQQPTAADFQVWRKGLGALSRTGNKLYKTLWKYISAPHKPNDWFINNAETEIYHRLTTGMYEHYTLTHSRHTTRLLEEIVTTLLLSNVSTLVSAVSLCLEPGKVKQRKVGK